MGSRRRRSAGPVQGAPLIDLDAIYADRDPVYRLRARSMLYVYALGWLGVVGISMADMTSHLPNKLGLGLTYGALLALLTAGIALLIRGRDDLAVHAVTGAFVVFSAATVMVGLDGTAPMFFKGWSKWYPVFIAVQGLFLARGAAAFVAAAGALWSVGYYIAFRAQLEGQIILSDLVDTVATQLIVGAIVVFLVGSLTQSLEAARSEADREHDLASALEGTVQQRTAELEEALRDRQRILDHMADGLLALVPGKGVVTMNQRFAALIGSPEHGADTVAEGLPNEVITLMMHTAATGEMGSDVLELDDRFVQVVATRSDDEVLILTARDVTREREIDRLKTEFIATVSHELRTPLTSVLGFSKMTRSRLAERVAPLVPDDAQRAQKAMGTALSNLDIVVSEGERLTALINDVLDIAKMEAGRVEWRSEPLQARALVEKSAAAVQGLFPADHPVTFRVHADDDAPLVGDGPRLVQVLVNLLSNAAKFTDKGQITLALEVRDEHATFSVSDTGRGIPASQHEAVFDRFRQVEDHLTDKPQGSGLGLPICQQILAAHGSALALDSEVGAGTTFTFSLPIAAAELEGEAPAGSA